MRSSRRRVRDACGEEQRASARARAESVPLPHPVTGRGGACGRRCSSPGKPQRTRRSRRSIGPGSRWTIGGQNGGETRRNPGQNPSRLNRSFGTICRGKSGPPGDSASACHAEGRGFESLQPLRRTSCSYVVSVPSSSLRAPGWEAFLLAGCQLVAKTPRPESSAKASSRVHPMSFSSVSRPPSPMSMTCW